LETRFYIDPATGAPHIHNHQVGEDEVIDVLDRPGEDRAGRDGSRVALGQTSTGRYLRVIYVPEHDGVFCDHRVRSDREAACGIPKTQKEETSMSQNNFPEGWDESRVRKVLAHYDEQSDDEALAEDEAGVASSETVMNVPHDLVSQVRELIAKRHA
jgi:hypothetical protein